MLFNICLKKILANWQLFFDVKNQCERILLRFIEGNGKSMRQKLFAIFEFQKLTGLLQLLPAKCLVETNIMHARKKTTNNKQIQDLKRKTRRK